jgi:hypothetical protein
MTMDESQTAQRSGRTDGPEHKPSGELGGHPVNADETAPGEQLPDPHGSGSPRPDTGGVGNERPEAVDDEPGSDL